MNAAQRRESILKRLSGAEAPVSASALAALLGVSRQIVVGDVALLRAGGAQIDATPRGYQLHPAEKGYTAILACVHSTEDEMRTDLAPYAVRIFSPDAGHAQVTHVQLALFFLVVTHNPLSPSVREAYCLSMNTFLTASRYPYPNTLQGTR